MTDDTVANHLQKALAEIDRLSTRLRRRRLLNAMRTIRGELLAARQALIAQALATPLASDLAADADTPAVTVIARPRSDTGSERAPAKATRRPTDATAPVWTYPAAPFTHGYCGAVPPWDESLGSFREFTEAEKSAGFHCRPLVRPT